VDRESALKIIDVSDCTSKILVPIGMTVPLVLSAIRFVVANALNPLAAVTIGLPTVVLRVIIDVTLNCKKLTTVSEAAGDAAACLQIAHPTIAVPFVVNEVQLGLVEGRITPVPFAAKAESVTG